MAPTWGLVFTPNEMAHDKRASHSLTCSVGLVYIPSTGKFHPHPPPWCSGANPPSPDCPFDSPGYKTTPKGVNSAAQ